MNWFDRHWLTRFGRLTALGSKSATLFVAYAVAVSVTTLRADDLLLATNTPAAEGPSREGEAVAPSPEKAEELYEDGLHHFKNLKDEAALKKGFALFEKAAEAGHADAMNAAGVAKTFGFGNEDMRGSVGAEWLRKAADAGSVKALYNQGLLILFKIGIKADEKLAWSYIEKAALKGYEPAQYQMGKLLLDPSVSYDPELALRWFQKAGKQGNKDAMAYVGWLNLSRKIEDANPELGLVLLRQLSDASNGAAKCFLGQQYAGLDPNDTNDLGLDLVFDYFIQAHEAGWRPDALEQAAVLARRIIEGDYADARAKHAIAFLERRETNDCLANVFLGGIRASKRSKYRDDAKAVAVLEAGAQRGCVQSVLMLGDMYEAGRGVETNLLKAENCYLSVMSKDTTGEAALKAAALLFSYGKHNDAGTLKKEYQAAFHAAKLGNARACDLLATMVLGGGLGEDHGKEEAYAWALIAAEHDLERYQTPVSEVEKKLTTEERLKGVKLSHFFKTMIRKHALEEGEDSFRF